MEPLLLLNWISVSRIIYQGCHGQGKVREFCGWPGKFGKDLESLGRVREFENKWQWQAVCRKFNYSVQEGKGCTFSLSPSLRGLLLKERICSPRGANSSFKSNPQIGSDTVTTIKVKNKNDFFICQRVWKTVKIREKLWEKSGNFEVNDKWQPCI